MEINDFHYEFNLNMLLYIMYAYITQHRVCNMWPAKVMKKGKNYESIIW